jgi:hypothetical protein
MHEWTSALRARLEPLRLPAAKEAAIVEELSQHLDDRRAELIAGGLDQADATAATLAELARADLLAPRLAAVHPPAPLEPEGGRRSRSAGLLQDLRYAARALSRQPGFSLVAIVTLAFGIGLNAAMFGFLNALILRPLPFPDAAAIARLYRTTPDSQHGAFAPADYLALQQEAGSSMRVAAYRTAGVSISDPGQSAEWYVATAGLFDLIGLPPILGRVYTAADEAAGNHRVVVLSYACWQSRFGADEHIVGKTVRGNDEVYEIIGVLSPDAGDQRLFGTPGLFSPLLFSAADRDERSSHAQHPRAALALDAGRAGRDGHTRTGSSPRGRVPRRKRANRVAERALAALDRRPDRTRDPRHAARSFGARAPHRLFESRQPAADASARSDARARDSHRARRLENAARTGHRD